MFFYISISPIWQNWQIKYKLNEYPIIIKFMTIKNKVFMRKEKFLEWAVLDNTDLPHLVQGEGNRYS